MKPSRYLLGSLAITILHGASCTTINNYGPPPPGDMAMPRDLSPPDMDPCGKVQSGTWMTLSATVNSDTCKTGLTAAQLMSNRMVQNDGQGTISIYSANGTFLYGSGPVRCNKGTLTAMDIISDGTCQWMSNRTVDVMVTADNRMSLSVTDARSNPMSEPGRVCTQPTNCAVSFGLDMKM